jgi:hypothetical protein
MQAAISSNKLAEKAKFRDFRTKSYRYDAFLGFF